MKLVITIIALVGVISIAGCKKSPTAGSGGTAHQVVDSIPPLAGTNVSLETAYNNSARAVERVILLLNGVKDDASAQAAAGLLRLAAADLAAAMKQMKLTVAALDTAGRKQEIVQFYQKLAEKETEPALFRFQPAIEHVVAGPQGPKLRSEINAVLDAIVENTTGKERENIQRWIQEKNLRQ